MKPLILLACLVLCVSANITPFKCSAYPTLTNKEKYGASTLCALEQIFLFSPNELTVRKEMFNKEREFYEDRIARLLNDNYYHIWKQDSKFATSGLITFKKVIKQFGEKMHRNNKARFEKYDEAFKEVISKFIFLFTLLVPKVNEFNIEQFNKLNEEEKDFFLQFLVLEIRLNMIIPIIPIEIATKLFGMNVDEVADKSICYDSPCIVTLTDGSIVIRTATINMLTGNKEKIQINSVFRDNEILSFGATDSLVFDKNSKDGSGFLMIVNYEEITLAKEYAHEEKKTKRHSLKTVSHPTEKITGIQNKIRNSVQLKRNGYHMDFKLKKLLSLLRYTYRRRILNYELSWSNNRAKHNYEYLLLKYEENIHRIRHTQILIRHELTYYMEVLQKSKKVFIPATIPGTKGEQYYILNSFNDYGYIGYKKEQIPDTSIKGKDSDIHIMGPPLPDSYIKTVIGHWLGPDEAKRYERKFMKPKEPDPKLLEKMVKEKFGGLPEYKVVENDWDKIHKKVEGKIEIKSDLVPLKKEANQQTEKKKKNSHLMKPIEEEKKVITDSPKPKNSIEKKDSIRSVKKDSAAFVNDGFHTPKKKKSIELN